MDWLQSALAFFDNLLATFDRIGPWAYLIIFAVALADSVIVTGTFTNAVIFLVLAGAMAARGELNIVLLIGAGAAGAILGGFISYYLGRAGSAMVRRKVEGDPDEVRNVSRTHALFDRFGGLAVVVGRFLGPLGSITAFVAGTIRMERATFAIWNVIAGVTWAGVFVLFGDRVMALF